MDVIRMMFWGDIFPAERVKADSPQFRDAKNEATAISEKNTSGIAAGICGVV